MTDKSAAAVREFCERWSQEWNENTGWYKSQIMYDKMLPDLTALISEGYVTKEKYMDDLCDEYQRGFEDGRAEANNNDRL